MRKATVALMLLMFEAGALAASGAEGSQTWRPIGPAPISTGFANFTVASGRVDVAVSDPTNPNVMYIGAGAGGGGGGGGVWKTSNYLTADAGGPTWVPLTDDFPSLSIFGKSLALYRDNPDILYAAAGGPNGGILKTVDGGAHWDYLLSDVFTSALFSALVIHSTDPNTVYVAVRGSVEGATPIAGGVYRLTFANTGASAVNLTAGVAPGSVATDVLIDPTNPLVLYAGLVRARDSTNNGVYQSTDGGKHWQLLTNGLLSGSQVGEWIALAMAPSAPQTVYTTIFKPENSPAFGVLRRFVTTDAGSDCPPQDACCSPAFVCKQGNLGNFLFYNVTLDPSDPHRGFGVSQDQIDIAKFTGEPTWTYVIDSGHGIGAEVGKVLIDPQDSDVVYNRSPLPPNGTFVKRSTDGGITWVAISNGIDMSEFSTALPTQAPNNAFALDEHRPSRLVLGGQRVWQTLDRGANWTPMNPLPSPTATNDDGTTWLERDQGLPLGSGNQTQDIIIDPADPNRVFIQTNGLTTNGRVWTTNDGGSSWTKLDADLPPNLLVFSLAVDWRFHRPTLYAGTTRGVFFSTDSGRHWAPFGQGLPRTIVYGLQLMPRNGLLVAATFGRGVYQIRLPIRPR